MASGCMPVEVAGRDEAGDALIAHDEDKAVLPQLLKEILDRSLR